MPYNHLDDLPDNVRNPLPRHAQEIFLEAFNHAWEEYADRDDREATARKVAWSAVKQQYRKDDGRWVKK